MAKPVKPKSINSEDYSKDDDAKTIASRMAFTLNNFMGQIWSAVYNLTISDNLNQEIVQLTLNVDASGVPNTQTSFRTEVRNVSGLPVIRWQNTDGTLVNSHPTIDYSIQSNNRFQIEHCIGLPVDTDFVLTILVIGD